MYIIPFWYVRRSECGKNGIFSIFFRQIQQNCNNFSAVLLTVNVCVCVFISYFSTYCEWIAFPFAYDDGTLWGCNRRLKIRFEVEVARQRNGAGSGDDVVVVNEYRDDEIIAFSSFLKYNNNFIKYFVEIDIFG